MDVGIPIYYSQISHGNMSHGNIEGHYIITMDPSKKLWVTFMKTLMGSFSLRQQYTKSLIAIVAILDRQ